MLSSPTTTKLQTLLDALMHFKSMGIDVDEAIDHLRADISECAIDETWALA